MLIVRIARHLPRAVIVILVFTLASSVMLRCEIKAVDEIVTLIRRTAESIKMLDLFVSVMLGCLRV
jgi:hypothetical protein